ncbi:MAG: hypothetical protein LBG60_09755 [Bifidobacteriaceae bacterium]|nr:hypothetical protein [Bifidobacteriaceae bacterium]
MAEFHSVFADGGGQSGPLAVSARGTLSGVATQSIGSLSASTDRTPKARAGLLTVEEFFAATLAADGPVDAEPANEILRRERDGR